MTPDSRCDRRSSKGRPNSRSTDIIIEQTITSYLTGGREGHGKGMRGLPQRKWTVYNDVYLGIGSHTKTLLSLILFYIR